MMLVLWGIQVLGLVVHRKRNKWRMKKDYTSPAVVRTGCPRCPPVCGTYRFGISLYPVRLIISMFYFCFEIYWHLYCLIISASVLLFSRKSWHHDLLFRWAVFSTEVFAEGAASLRHVVSLYRSALYNQMGDNTGTDDDEIFCCFKVVLWSTNFFWASSVTNSLSHLHCTLASLTYDKS